jgi:hypothetical protein
MKHLPLMLEGSARAWLNQLPANCIYCWDDLARVFVKTFEGTYKRPGGLTELQHCVQKNNETLREYIQRWTTLHNTVENVTEHQAVCAFKAGTRYRELVLKFGRSGDLSLSRAMEIANKYANGEEEDRLRSGKARAGNAPQSGGNTGKNQKRKADASSKAKVAAIQGQGQGKPKPKKKKKEWIPKKKSEYKSDILDQPCQIHTKMDEEGNVVLPKHTTRECRLLKQEMGAEPSSEKVDVEDEEDTSEYPKIDKVINVIFADVERRRQLKVINREVNMAVPTATKYLN